MALKKVHRHDDARVCGATTIATDHKVYANGKLIAVNAKTAGIDTVVFDRSGFLYHGRVKALADSAREEGLKF